MSTAKTIKIIYSATLFLLAVFIWRLLYSAQFLEYDENYGVLIAAFLLSLLATTFPAILWFKARSFIWQNSVATILFLLAASPLTVALVFYFYNHLFQHLKN